MFPKLFISWHKQNGISKSHFKKALVTRVRKHMLCTNAKHNVQIKMLVYMHFYMPPNIKETMFSWDIFLRSVDTPPISQSNGNPTHLIVITPGDEAEIQEGGAHLQLWLCDSQLNSSSATPPPRLHPDHHPVWYKNYSFYRWEVAAMSLITSMLLNPPVADPARGPIFLQQQ